MTKLLDLLLPPPPPPRPLHQSPRQARTGASSCPRSGIVCLKERQEVSFPRRPSLPWRTRLCIPSSLPPACTAWCLPWRPQLTVSLYIGLHHKQSEAQVSQLVSQQTRTAVAPWGAVSTLGVVLSLGHCGAPCVVLGMQRLLSKLLERNGRKSRAKTPAPAHLPSTSYVLNTATREPPGESGRLATSAKRSCQEGGHHPWMCSDRRTQRCICYILSLPFIGVFLCLFLLVAPEQASCRVPAGAGAGARTLFSPRMPHAYAGSF